MGVQLNTKIIKTAITKLILKWIVLGVFLPPVMVNLLAMELEEL